MRVTARRLLDLVDTPDPYAFPNEEILPLQIAAVQETFEELRHAIPLLQQRADEAGIDEITTLEDIVPLLFSHTVYKSYPQSFVAKGQWDRLLAWYESLAGPSMGEVDLDGVRDIDDFAAAIAAAGFVPHVTSGTSGKVSLLNNTVGDRERSHRIGGGIYGWPRPTPQHGTMRFYGLGPSQGFSKHVEFSRSLGEIFSKPGAMRFLTDEPILPSQTSKAVTMRARMTDGTATPEEIDAFQAEIDARTARHASNLHEMALDIIEHRREPMIVMGIWTQHWAIMELAHELGCGDGEFHEDSVNYFLGGLKGVVLPPDYREQIFRFYGNTGRFMTYGMTEIDPTAPVCPAGRYHRPPWVMWLVLDQEGERLAEVDEDGILDGRMAVMSINHEGRWGGLITGDHVHMDTKDCACGRPGPTIIDDVTRYSEQQGGDDKIGCAGTMEAYLRGMVGA